MTLTLSMENDRTILFDVTEAVRVSSPMGSFGSQPFVVCRYMESAYNSILVLQGECPTESFFFFLDRLGSDLLSS